MIDERKCDIILRVLSKIHFYYPLDKVLTNLAEILPIPLITTSDGNKFSLGFSSILIVKEVYCDAVYDKFFRPKSGDTVVDIGAHIGIFSLKVSKRVGDRGKVIDRA